MVESGLEEDLRMNTGLCSGCHTNRHLRVEEEDIHSSSWDLLDVHSFYFDIKLVVARIAYRLTLVDDRPIMALGAQPSRC